MTKRRKIIAIALLLVLVVGATGSYFVARNILIRRTMSWRRDGIAASIAGDHEKAVTLLARYLNRRPQDIEALSYYVNSRELVPLPNGQNLAQTVDCLRMLLALDPNRIDDRRHLMKLYYELDRGPEALDVATSVLAKIPKDLSALEIKTKVLMRLDRNHEAMDAADAWVAAAPLQLDSQMIRMGLEQRLGRSSDLIIADADNQRQAHPGDPRFECLLGFAFEQAGNNARAVQWLKTAAQHPVLPKDVVLLLVQQLDLQGLPADSLALLERAQKQSGDADLRTALVHRYWEMGRWKDLVAILADVDPANSTADATAVAMKADALSRLGQTSESESCKKALAARTDPAARAWTAILSRTAHPTPADLRNTARACSTAAGIDPTNPYYFYFIGDSDAQIGELDLGIAALRRSMDLDVAWTRPPARLVETMLQKGRPDEAFDVATVAAQRSPSNAAAILSLARAWAAEVENGSIGKADQLLNLIVQIQKELPNDDRLALIQVQLLAQQGHKPDAAQAALAQMSRKPPPAESFFLAIVTLSHKYNLGIEQQCLSKFQQTYSVTPTFAYAQAVDRLLSGNGADGLEQFDNLAKQSGHAGDLDWQMSRARYLDISADPNARSAWIALRDAYPNDLTVQQSVVSAQMIQGDWDALSPAIDHLHALTGDNALTWRLAQVRLMVDSPRNDKDDGEKAAIQLNQLLQSYPDLPELHVLLGRDLVRLQRIDGAVQQFSKASELDPANVEIALQLAALLQSQGDFQRVQDELDRISPQLRTDSDRQRAALLLNNQNNPAAAAKILEKPSSTADESSTAQDNADLFLAYLYRRQHDYDRAELIARRLLQHPTPVVIQFAASLFTAEGKTSDAEKTLGLLDSIKLDPGMKELLWGSHYAETGNFALAAPHYLAATQQSGAPATAWQLLAACQVSLGLRDDAIATIAAGAKAYPKDEGLSLLNQNSALLYTSAQDRGLDPITTAILKAPLSSSDDLDLLQTIVDAWQSSDSQLLASRLQDFVQRRPQSLNAQVQLIECYQAMGRASDAVSAAHKAVNAFPTDVQVVRVAVRICEMAGQWPDLSRFAQELKRRSPGDAQEADTALAMSDLGLNEPDAAVSQLMPYAAAAQADPNQNPQLLSLYACALADSGKADDAANLIWPFARTQPQWRQQWVGIARGMPDRTQAAAWLDRLNASLPADDIADRATIAEAFNFLGQRDNDSSLTAKSTDLFKSVVSAPSADAKSLLMAAMQAESCSDWPRAQADYRLVLKQDATSFLAANNLAMLLIKHGGDPHEALQFAQQAVQLQPRVATFYDTLAAVHGALGDAPSAVKDESIAIQLDPDAAEWKVHTAQYHLDAGDPAAAARIIQDMDLAGFNPQSLSEPLQKQLDSIRSRLKHSNLG
jgi:predicted Zn-dependent protease